MRERRGYIHVGSYRRGSHKYRARELQKCLREYIGKNMEAMDNDREHRKGVRCRDKLNAFLDCEFRNPVAMLLNAMFRKLAGIIKNKKQ